MILSALTTEYIEVPVSSDEIDPLTLPPPQMAIVGIGEDPAGADWITGQWIAIAGVTRARVLCGTGGMTLEKGQYDLWLKFAAAPETIVRELARIGVK